MIKNEFVIEKKKKALNLIYDSYIYHHDFNTFSLEDIVEKMRVYLDNKEFYLLKKALKEYKDYIISIFASSFYVKTTLSEEDLNKKFYKKPCDNLFHFE